jgi:hypothetical protein
VHVVGYESLVQDPMTGFADLSERFGLTWSDAAAGRVREATTERAGAEQRKFSWSFRGGVSRTAYRPQGAATALSTYRNRLTPAEVERVRELTAEVAGRVLPAVRTATSEAG